jgi:hypothetical protein
MKTVAMALFCGVSVSTALGQYREVTPRKDLKADEVAVSKPGSYADAGKTYVLTADISSPMTPLFLGKDVTLDLNGHTITFADGKYEHIPNYGFEEDLTGWDVSKAKGAKVLPSSVRPMVGEKILELKAGDEIVSSYVNLPLANRSYYAMCAVGTNEMKVTINVEDEAGNPVTCEFNGFNDKRVTVPEINRNPELGGGTIFAHMHHQAAGKYRLRIKAETDCQIDECDIRPALDAGIGIVGAIKPAAGYTSMIRWAECAFFDYNKEDTNGVAVDGIPVVKGAGKITIKNGIIRNGTVGMRTLGILSNAADVTVTLENVKILNAGINANAARLSRATLRNCRFEVDTPFIINRHDTSEMNVSVGEATEVANCEFIGGQGNFSGGCPLLHDNLFVNCQTVTNHYSISPRSGTKVFRNQFKPKVGSGIYIGCGTGVEVYDNVFEVEAAPPNAEYRYGTYSTTAIRISDYDAKPTDPAEKRCFGNKVYRNKIHVTGKGYPQLEKYDPRAYAFYITVGGGTNEVYENEITVDNKDIAHCGAFAFLIAAASNGGEIYRNKVTSNCPVMWIGSNYGSASNTLFYGNTFTKVQGTLADVKMIVLGDGGNTANDLGFYSNELEGWTDLFEYHSNSISYAWGWTATVKVLDKDGKPKATAEVVIAGKDGNEVRKAITGDKGVASVRLAEYTYKDGKKTDCRSYTVKSGKAETMVEMMKDQDVTLRDQ